MSLKSNFVLTPEDIQFAENLKIMSDVLNMSQKDIAEYFNVHRVTINHYFNLKGHPTLQFLIALERSTGIAMIAWVTRSIDKSEFPPKLITNISRVEEPRAPYAQNKQCANMERRLSRIEEFLKLPKIGDI